MIYIFMRHVKHGCRLNEVLEYPGIHYTTVSKALKNVKDTDISKPAPITPDLSQNKKFIKFWPFVWLALSLLIPYSSDVQKYLGYPGLVVYLLFVPAAVFFYLRLFLPFFNAGFLKSRLFCLHLCFWPASQLYLW